MTGRPRPREVLALSLGFVVTIALGLQLVLHRYTVQESSMTPGVDHGDRMLVVPSRGLPERGALVLFGGKGPAVYVKRVVALPGETVEVRDGVLRVDDVPAEQGPRRSASYPDLRCLSRPVLALDERVGEARWTAYLDVERGEMPDYGPLTVPPDSVFVLGDNRHHSLDSRRHGPVALDEVVGVVWKVLRSGRCDAR